jgi:hypothetical protein
MNKQSSQKGKYGKVGAPPKTVRIPTGSFTIERAIALNTDSKTGKLKVCKLTIRKRVAAAINGFYWTGSKKAGNLRKVKVPKTHKLGDSIPQPNGGVGRPSYRIIPVDQPVKKSAPVVNVTVKKTVQPTPKTPDVTAPVVTVPTENITAPTVPTT